MGERIIKKILFQNQNTGNTGIEVSDRKITEEFPLHWHNYLEFELITGGRGYQVLNGQRLELSAGCLSVIRLTDFHQVVPEQELRLLNLMVDDRVISKDVLGQLISEQTMFYRLEPREAYAIEQLFRLCMEENHLPEPDQRYLKHLLACIFIRVLKLSKAAGNKALPEEQPIQAAILYLHMHFRENPRLQDAAKVAHYNPSHFSATFHKEMGMTYCDYLNLIKISYAKELLLSTELNISDICFECGFASQSNFARLFKEHTGVSPVQFRKSAAAASERG